MVTRFGVQRQHGYNTTDIHTEKDACLVERGAGHASRSRDHVNLKIAARAPRHRRHDGSQVLLQLLSARSLWLECIDPICTHTHTESTRIYASSEYSTGNIAAEPGPIAERIQAHHRRSLLGSRLVLLDIQRGLFSDILRNRKVEFHFHLKTEEKLVESSSWHLVRTNRADNRNNPFKPK